MNEDRLRDLCADAADDLDDGLIEPADAIEIAELCAKDVVLGSVLRNDPGRASVILRERANA